MSAGAQLGEQVVQSHVAKTWHTNQTPCQDGVSLACLAWPDEGSHVSGGLLRLGNFLVGSKCHQVSVVSVAGCASYAQSHEPEIVLLPLA